MNYIETLRNEICEVVFTKKDGTERNMCCTLHPDVLPIHETGTDNPIDFPPQNNSVLTVWDIEADGWRSIRPETIIKFTVVTED